MFIQTPMQEHKRWIISNRKGLEASTKKKQYFLKDTLLWLEGFSFKNPRASHPTFYSKHSRSNTFRWYTPISKRTLIPLFTQEIIGRALLRRKDVYAKRKCNWGWMQSVLEPSASEQKSCMWKLFWIAKYVRVDWWKKESQSYYFGFGECFLFIWLL